MSELEGRVFFPVSCCPSLKEAPSRCASSPPPAAAAAPPDESGGFPLSPAPGAESGARPSRREQGPKRKSARLFAPLPGRAKGNARRAWPAGFHRQPSGRILGGGGGSSRLHVLVHRVTEGELLRNVASVRLKAPGSGEMVAFGVPACRAGNKVRCARESGARSLGGAFLSLALLLPPPQ